MNVRSVIQSHQQNRENGQVIILTTLLLVILLAFLAIAADASLFYQHKRMVQTAADSAALAGAHEIKRNLLATPGDVVDAARTDAATNKFTHGVNNIDVAVFQPPTSGYYVGNNSFVEAIITQQRRTFFARVFTLLSGGDFNTATIRARATAGPGSSACVYVLDPDDEKAFEISSGSFFTAECGAQVNSNDPLALSVTSGSGLTATAVNINGNYESTSGSSVSPDPNTGTPAIPDPLGYLSPPSFAGCDHTDFELNSETQTLNPGVYCGGITLKSGSHATLTAGTYILNGGGLEVLSGSSIEGSGVFFYNTGTSGGTTERGRTFIESNSEAQLSAPATGTYAGILFFQERADPDNSNLTASIESNSNSWFHGTLYFPFHKLRFHSNSTLTSAAPWTAIVSRLLEVSSNTDASINSNFASSSIPSPLARPTLME